MPELPARKAGIVACSGEEIAEGTVSRLAALKVLHETRRGETVTICLPLFLAGGEGDRAFARVHPTITVDGCELRCAARGTEMYSGKPAASLVVSDFLRRRGMEKPDGRRRLNDAGMRAVAATSARLAEMVDEVLGLRCRDASVDEEVAPAAKFPAVACSCGSGLPMSTVLIEGRPVEVAALPLIFRSFHDADRAGNADLAGELLDSVKVYNAVAPEDEPRLVEALLREYRVYCETRTS
ncbi:MAG: putative zinc-binding protein [Thermoanaerobaculia bacterium]